VSRRLPAISGVDATRALEQLGFARVSQRGSHLKLRHGDGRTVIVPLHRKLARGTLSSILRQAGLTAEELRELL
jgi:predicted RNA binding protein YcfA (HicA-like mRNA interferase family)